MPEVETYSTETEQLQPIDLSSPKVAIVSSGLGTTTRGFEISAARWFEALRRHSRINVRLFAGGKYPRATSVWNMARKSYWTFLAEKMPLMSEQQRWEFCYGVEQISFWSALNFNLLAWRPDVVWVKDVPLAHLLLASRVMFGLKYKIIFANGGMLRPQNYKDFDIIQQLSVKYYEEALEYGIPAQSMEVLSNCFPEFAAKEDRQTLRQRLGLSPGDWAIACVAAWNKYHKRIDYLLREAAAMNDPAVKLILCGAEEVDSAELKQLANEILPGRVSWLTLPPDQIPNILRASDVFVLPSLRESLGNALVEAIFCGLPVVTHPHNGARFVIRDESWFVDLSQPENLTSRLRDLKCLSPSAAALLALREDVRHRFSEETLVPQFETMIRNACRR